MASSSGKPTAVHFSLIFFVMLTIIFGAVAWLQTSAYSEAKAREDKLAEENTKLTNANRGYVDDISAIKKRLGSGLTDVGSEETPNTLLGAVAEDIRNYGGFPQGTPASQLPTVHDALIELRRQLDQLQGEYNTAVANLKARNDEYSALLATYQQKEDVAREAQAAAEKIRDDVQNAVTERLAAADKQFQDKVAEFAAAKAEWENDKAAFENQIAALEKETKDLIAVNQRFQEKLDGIERLSFEVADGEIRTVDHVSRVVWINLGSDDNLTPRTTFSVYKKGHSGIGRGSEDTDNGRGAEDVKGAIEVTRILGPHLAEARLIDTDIYDPIAPGDPIYTPLWSPGRTESFSIVGFIDVDGDGKSDRELLREFVAASGGRFDTEVDDAGNRSPEGKTISEQTKFLVVAQLPDPSTTADADEKKLYGEILKHFNDMEKEARQQGVRKISLGDFLSYIGYRPKRRLWRPGDGTPYKLKSGAKSTATSETLGNRESSGQTSGIYSRGNRLKKPSPGRRTTESFRGSSKNYDR